MQDSATTASVVTVSAPASAQRWRSEDWMAVVLGFLVIATVLLAFQWKLIDLRNVIPNLRWTTDSQIASMTPAWTAALTAIERDASQPAAVIDLSRGLRTALAGQDR